MDSTLALLRIIKIKKSYNSSKFSTCELLLIKVIIYYYDVEKRHWDYGPRLKKYGMNEQHKKKKSRMAKTEKISKTRERERKKEASGH